MNASAHIRLSTFALAAGLLPFQLPLAPAWGAATSAPGPSANPGTGTSPGLGIGSVPGPVANTALASGPAPGEDPCRNLPTAAQLQTVLAEASTVGGDAGGLFHGQRVWGALVNRSGEACAVATSTPDLLQVWPGSRAIALSKAFTANGFSVDVLPLSTARLYTLSLPGHSLFGVNEASPFNPRYLTPPDEFDDKKRPAGGIITVGGGVPLYANGRVIGALGVSGDTACADHEIAKRVRALFKLDPPTGASTDDIVYPSDAPSVFAHPLCLNTFRNGTFIGTEKPGPSQ